MVCLRSLGTNPLSALRWSNSGRMLHNDRPASPGWAYETPSTLPRCRMVDAVGVATLALHIVGQSIRFRDQIHQRRQALSILGAKMERVYISLLESNAAGTAPFERDILSPIIDQSFALLQRAESRSGRRKRICRALRPEDDIALAHELSRAFDNALMQIELYRLSCKVDTSVRLASAPRPNENCGDPATHILPTAIEVVPGTQGPTFNRCNSVYSGDHLLRVSAHCHSAVFGPYSRPNAEPFCAATSPNARARASSYLFALDLFIPILYPLGRLIVKAVSIA